MESASFESTSTTDCMSDSGSVLYSENSNYGNVDIDDDVSFVNAHIGEIDEGAPLRVLASNHQANIRYAGEQQEGSTRAANSYSDDSDEDNAINNSHDDDDSSIMYDSVMEEIRKDIWEQVRQAKLKKENKARTIQQQENQGGPNGSRSTRASLPNNSQRDPAGRRLDTPTEDEANTLEPSQPFGNHHDDTSDQTSEPEAKILSMTNELILFETGGGEDLASVNAVRDSISLLRTARAFTRCRDDSSSKRAVGPQHDNSHPHGSSPARNQTTREKSGLMSAPSDEMWDVQDDMVSLLINEKDVASVTQSLQEIQDAEADSLFDSILAIELEEKKAQTKAAEPEKPKSNIATTSKKAPGPRKVIFSDSFLRAKVHGSLEETILYMPIAFIEKRETEMKQRATAAGIGDDQWRGSLLGRKILSKKGRQQHKLITVELHPESKCAEANYSQTFEWQPWLNECIESFYKTGSMRVPDFCVGPDLLVALQYFGILYTPDQLIFDAFSTYLRVKLWSEYFTHRGTIAAWLTDKLYQSHGKHTHIFSTCPNPIQEGSFVDIGNRSADVFDGGISLDPNIYGNTASSTVLYSFFNENDDANEDPSNMGALMREDFCNYFCKLVPGIDASFPMKTTAIRHINGTSDTVQLATLYIRLKLPSPSTQQELSHFEEESSQGSDTTRNYSPAVLTSMFNTCHMPKNSAMDQCLIHTKTKSSTFDQNMKKNWASPDSWLPVQSPESVSAFSVEDCKDSNIFDGWMSAAASSKTQKNTFFGSPEEEGFDGATAGGWPSEAPAPAPAPAPTPTPTPTPTPIAPTSKATLKQQVKNLLDSESSDASTQFADFHSKAKANREIQINVDHIYEDLWLHETAFDDGWEAKMPTHPRKTLQTKNGAANTGMHHPKTSAAKTDNQSNSQVSKQANSKSYSKHPKRDSSIGAKNKKKMTSSRRGGGRPSHFLCDTVGSRPRPGRNAVSNSKPVPGIDYPDDEEHF